MQSPATCWFGFRTLCRPTSVTSMYSSVLTFLFDLGCCVCLKYAPICDVCVLGSSVRPHGAFSVAYSRLGAQLRPFVTVCQEST